MHDDQLDSELDKLLCADLLEVPADFSARIMQRIDRLPLRTRGRAWLQALQRFALLAGAMMGAAQMAAFMFGMWTASAAG